MREAEFLNAKLNGGYTGAPMRFSNVKLQKAKFNNSLIIFTNFSDNNMESADFSGAKLYRQFGRYPNAEPVIFTNANLRNAKFNDAVLIGVKFEKSNLSGANFRWFELSNVKFDKDTNLSGAIWLNGYPC